MLVEFSFNAIPTYLFTSATKYCSMTFSLTVTPLFKVCPHLKPLILLRFLMGVDSVDTFLIHFTQL